MAVDRVGLKLALLPQHEMYADVHFGQARSRSVCPLSAEQRRSNVSGISLNRSIRSCVTAQPHHRKRKKEEPERGLFFASAVLHRGWFSLR